jgi:site-specific DNA-cytosine methylase
VRVLVAFECSGVVREAFRSWGHDAWSCDLKPAEDESAFHVQGDAFDVMREPWDLIIAHPPCTDICVSGARWFAEKRADGRQGRAVDLFMAVVNVPCERLCIENPVGIMSTLYRKPDCIIQPWMFGHGETKATCLWLKGLPTLRPTKIVSGREGRVWKMGPSERRAADRSRTYRGVAEAMAEQWGGKE